MVKHCCLWEEMISGKKKYKRVFIGRLFGKMALKDFLKDEKPMMRNAASIPELKIRENGNVSAERTKWIKLIEEHAHFSNSDFVHPFFGKMTKEEIGYLAYKHTTTISGNLTVKRQCHLLKDFFWLRAFYR